MGIIVVNHSMRLMKNIKALHWISSYLGLRADGELQRQDYLLLSKKHSETVQKLFGSKKRSVKAFSHGSQTIYEITATICMQQSQG